MAYTTTEDRSQRPPQDRPRRKSRCDECKHMVIEVRDVGGRTLCTSCFLAQFPPDSTAQAEALTCDLCSEPVTQAHESSDGLLLCGSCAEGYRPDPSTLRHAQDIAGSGTEETTALAGLTGNGLPATLNTHKQAILQLEGQIKGRILEIGKHLAGVRDALADNKAGGFEAWIEQELGWAKQTAYNYLNVYERFGNGEDLHRLEALPRRALYALAAKTTPDDVCEQVFERAGQGEQLTFKEVERMIREAIAQQRPPIDTAARPSNGGAGSHPAHPAQAAPAVCGFCPRSDLPVYVSDNDGRIGICASCAHTALTTLTKEK